MCIHREESFESKLPLGSTSLQIASLRSYSYIYIYIQMLCIYQGANSKNIIELRDPSVRNSMIRLHRMAKRRPHFCLVLDKPKKKMLGTGSQRIHLQKLSIDAIEGRAKRFGLLSSGESTRRGVREIRGNNGASESNFVDATSFLPSYFHPPNIRIKFYRFLYEF